MKATVVAGVVCLVYVNDQKTGSIVVFKDNSGQTRADYFRGDILFKSTYPVVQETYLNPNSAVGRTLYVMANYACFGESLLFDYMSLVDYRKATPNVVLPTLSAADMKKRIDEVDWNTELRNLISNGGKGHFQYRNEQWTETWTTELDGGKLKPTVLLNTTRGRMELEIGIETTTGDVVVLYFEPSGENPWQWLYWNVAHNVTLATLVKASYLFADEWPWYDCPDLETAPDHPEFDKKFLDIREALQKGVTPAL
ncbi:MAG: hypothetical protein U0L04_02640 [Bacteroidaceae bacterium]|nr:hypothetical protein [Bacteroidaceae bacterium]